MKWPKTQQTATAGVLFVESVVNAHGSIFRPVHQETDVGIDGYIELVNVEEASGRLIAVQIKSGNSYFSEQNHEFVVSVDQRHLDYWESYMVPIVLICYSPSQDVGAWASIRDFIEHEKYHDRLPITQVRVPPYHPFDTDALNDGIAGLAHARADERILLKCADMCLSQDQQIRREGFSILRAHPDSRGLKITAMFARRFLMDEHTETAKDALFTLAYAVGRRRWSWNPNNKEEGQIVDFACDLCRNISEAEVRRLVELVDGEHFSGPQGLGERCFDVLCCCFETAERVLDDIASDKSLSMERRSNALYMLNECDDERLEEHREYYRGDSRLGDVYEWMFQPVDEPNE